MPLFSQRKGIRPMRKAVQKDSIDKELRNSLWSALCELIYRKYAYSHYDPVSQEIKTLFNQYWLSYFKLPSDNQPDYGEAVERVRNFSSVANGTKFTIS